LIRVLHLVTDLGQGGAQSVLVRMLAAQDRSLVAPEVAWLKPVARPGLVGQLEERGIPCHPMGMTCGNAPSALLGLARLLRRRRPQVLQCWLYHADLVGSLLGRLCGVPVVLGSRRNTELGGPWRERLHRWTAPLFDRVVALSHQVAQVERVRAGLPASRVVVIYNGIEAGPFQDLPLPSGAPRLGILARLHRNKALDVALQAMPRILAVWPQTRLEIFGEGPERGRLERLRAELGLSECVSLPGMVEDVPGVLAGLDLVLLPSRIEGMGNALMEAMAAGRPVVATRVGGVPELVVHGQTGLLVEPDDAQGLARAVLALLADRDLRVEMGQAGRRRVLRDFTPRAMAGAMERLYLEVLAEKLR